MGVRPPPPWHPPRRYTDDRSSRWGRNGGRSCSAPTPSPIVRPAGVRQPSSPTAASRSSTPCRTARTGSRSGATSPRRRSTPCGALRACALSALVADIAARSSASGGGVVPVRDCLYAALFALNVATCFGDGVVDSEQVVAMRVAQREFLRILPSFRVFATFQKVAKLLYRDRWNCGSSWCTLAGGKKRYLPLIRACQEQRRAGNTTATSYVDTLLDLEVPTEGDPHLRRKLSDGKMVSLVSKYLGASTGTVLALLEWTLAKLVLQPDIQSRLRGDVEAAGGEACAYLQAVVVESLRRHPPVPSVQRHMSSDVLVGSTTVARGTLVNFSLEEIGRDGKIWRSREEFIPDRFMPGGEGAGVRLTIGSKDTTKVKTMPFGTRTKDMSRNGIRYRKP